MINLQRLYWNLIQIYDDVPNPARHIYGFNDSAWGELLIEFCHDNKIHYDNDGNIKE